MSILANRDINLNMQNQLTHNSFGAKGSTAEVENAKPQSMEYHRQVLENKLREGEGQSAPSYVSPSDSIMSPASQKLSSFKQRQVNKQMGAPVKSRSLFAKAMTAREKDFAPIGDKTEEA